mgnify:FL=1
MNSEILEAKLASIEALRKPFQSKRTCVVLRGYPKGEGKFDIKEIESVKIKFKEKL